MEAAGAGTTQRDSKRDSKVGAAGGRGAAYAADRELLAAEVRTLTLTLTLALP